jgi:hypothetical protein
MQLFRFSVVKAEGLEPLAAKVPEITVFVGLVGYVAVTKNDIQEMAVAYSHCEQQRLAAPQIEGQPQIAES